MSTHIIINDREITNPAIKFSVIVASTVCVGIITAALLFLVLPLVGISIAAAFSFALIVVACVAVAFVTIGLGSTLLSMLIGPFEFLVRKVKRH